MDDFNSHSLSWGYDDLDHKGDEVEDWIITHNMVLINKADDPPTFYSRACVSLVVYIFHKGIKSSVHCGYEVRMTMSGFGFKSTF